MKHVHIYHLLESGRGPVTVRTENWNHGSIVAAGEMTLRLLHEFKI